MDSADVTLANGDSEEPDFCEGWPMSAVGIEVDENGKEQSVEVLDEGYPCPNEPVGLFRMRVRYAGEDTMAFWFCEDCRESHAEAIIEEVSGA